ncbi:MAG: SAM-dependent chlorinase/fluorinase [Bacteroidetes bacterium]|nr:SAM-dependent chlorinase/fluorinase [Bacteroidota bacterium]
MPLITLTTDLGTTDPTVPILKGYLCSKIENLQIVDITHSIRPFHMVDCAFLLANSYQSFPLETIHIVGVEGDFARQPEFIMAKLHGHYFVTKNSGLLSLLSQSEPEWVVKLQPVNAIALKMPLVHILGKAATDWLLTKNKDKIGQAFSGLTSVLPVEPRIVSNCIVGSIIYETPYNNVLTNIHRKHVEQFSHAEKISINYGRNNYFYKIHNSYYDVEEGEAACFFNAIGLLEIGIHGGNGTNLLSLFVGGKIILEFE